MLEHCTLFPMWVIGVKGRRFGEKRCLATKLTTFRDFNDNRATSLFLPRRAITRPSLSGDELINYCAVWKKKNLKRLGPNTWIFSRFEHNYFSPDHLIFSDRFRSSRGNKSYYLIRVYKRLSVCSWVPLRASRVGHNFGCFNIVNPSRSLWSYALTLW